MKTFVAIILMAVVAALVLALVGKENSHLDRATPSAGLSEQGASSFDRAPEERIKTSAFSPVMEAQEISETRPALQTPVIRVLDERGDPLPGARCELWANIPARHELGHTNRGAWRIPRREPDAVVSTDASGLLDWDGWTQGLWQLRVRKSDLGAYWQHRVRRLSKEAQARGHGRPEFTVRLGRQRQFEVRVEDERGRPLPGAIVAFCNPDARWIAPYASGGTETSRFDWVMTDDDGTAMVLMASSDSRGIGRSRRLRASVVSTSAETTERIITWEGFEGPLVLVAPGIATVRLIPPELPVVDEAPSPKLYWKADEPPPEFAGTIFRSGVTLEGTQRLFLDYQKIWCLRAGQDAILLSCFAPGSKVGWIYKRRGYSTGSGVWSVPEQGCPDLNFGPGLANATVVARFENTAGDPTRPERFGRIYSRADSDTFRFWERRDDGSLAWQVTARETGEYLVLRPGAYEPNGTESILARLEWPALDPGAIHDVGTVVLPEFPVLATGIVSDRDGVPVIGAIVKASYPKSKVALGRRDNTDWTTKTDKAGRFTLRYWPRSTNDRQSAFKQVLDGPSTLPKGMRDAIEQLQQEALGSEGIWKIHASAKRRQGPEQEIRAGARNLVLELPRKTGLAGLAGRARAVNVSASALEVCYFKAGFPHDKQVWCDADGRFEVSNLEPGEYRISVRLEGSLVLLVENVLVRPGEIARPPELADFVIGDDHEWVDVLVLDRDGNPVVGARVEHGASLTELALNEHLLGPTSDAQGHVALFVRPSGGLLVRVRPEPFHGGDIRLMEELLVGPAFPLTVRLKAFSETYLRATPTLPDPGTGHWSFSLRRPKSGEELAAERESERHNRRRGWSLPRRSYHHVGANEWITRRNLASPALFDRAAAGEHELVLVYIPKQRTYGPKQITRELSIGPINIPSGGGTVQFVLSAEQIKELQRLVRGD